MANRKKQKHLNIQSGVCDIYDRIHHAICEFEELLNSNPDLLDLIEYGTVNDYGWISTRSQKDILIKKLLTKIIHQKREELTDAEMSG